VYRDPSDLLLLSDPSPGVGVPPLASVRRIFSRIFYRASSGGLVSGPSPL